MNVYPVDSRAGVEPFLLYLDMEIDRDAEVDADGRSTHMTDRYVAWYMARLGLPVLPENYRDSD